MTEPTEETLAPPDGDQIIDADVVETTAIEVPGIDEVLEKVQSADEAEEVGDPTPIEIRPCGIMNTISAPIEVAIYKHAGKGEDPSWMAGSLVVPAPDGSGLSIQQYITLSIGSPLIGEPAPTATAMVDLRQLRDMPTAERLVQQLLVNARELRSKMLDDANPAKEPQPDFSDLVAQGAAD